MRRIHALRHFLRRLGGRLYRAWCRVLGRNGADRAQVRELTETDLSHTYLLLGFTAGTCGTALAFAFVITFSGRFLCH
ncbi:hypothetical protein [Paraburkholderia caribensis]|uniref:hypothetical protein n=1 Tax=Paraburkholderia caribensis TaxID=75105 RepID=UPI001D0865E7|nr:hypothetical protein [Paraburkholderia caribensis]